jgi:hypothetical protein
MPLVHTRPIARSLYLGSLALLQFALAVQVAPSLARTFKAHALFASLHDGWTVAAHLGGLALAVIGAAVALNFPLLALARHAKRGRLRFLGLPRWAIHLATAGAALFAAALIGAAGVALLPGDVREMVAPIAQSAATAGTAMMAAGALCAELLRRSIPPVPVPQAPWQCTPARIVALDPLDRSARLA